MTKKNRAEPERIINDLWVVIKHEEEIFHSPRDGFVDQFESHNHVICVNSGDVESLVPGFINGTFNRPAKSKTLTVTCPEQGEVDIGSILDAADQWVDDSSTIILHRCYVPQAVLDRVVSRWWEVCLFGCALGPGWQAEKSRDSACCWLDFRGCTAAGPDELEIGCASWPELDMLTIDDGRWNAALHSANAIRPYAGTVHRSPYQRNPSQLMKAYLGSDVTSLSLHNWNESPRLCDLPDQQNLDDVTISGTPTGPDDLAWITRQPKIDHVSLSWLPKAKLPWKTLSSLSKLTFLDVTSSPCNDADLNDILDHTQLRTIHLYYSQVTPALWARLFSTPSLKSVWVSAEMLEGDLPINLPTKTGLKEVVAMNVGPVHVEFLRTLLRKYPGVAIVKM